MSSITTRAGVFELANASTASASQSSTGRPSCAKCGDNQSKLLQCAKCKDITETCYCSKECQKADWPAHKPYCKAKQEELKEKANDVAEAVYNAMKPFRLPQDKEEVRSVEIEQFEGCDLPSHIKAYITHVPPSARPDFDASESRPSPALKALMKLATSISIDEHSDVVAKRSDVLAAEYQGNQGWQTPPNERPISRDPEGNVLGVQVYIQDYDLLSFADYMGQFCGDADVVMKGGYVENFSPLNQCWTNPWKEAFKTKNAARDWIYTQIKLLKSDWDMCKLLQLPRDEWVVELMEELCRFKLDPVLRQYITRVPVCIRSEFCSLTKTSKQLLAAHSTPASYLRWRFDNQETLTANYAGLQPWQVPPMERPLCFYEGKLRGTRVYVEDWEEMSLELFAKQYSGSKQTYTNPWR